MAASRSTLAIGLLAGAAFLVASGYTTAQNDLSISFHTFQDSRGVTVHSPDIAVNKDFTDRTAVRFKFGVDAISAASDSCARCHQDGASNGRAVGGVSVVRKYGDTKVTAGAELSREMFYTATTLLSSVSRDTPFGGRQAQNRPKTDLVRGFVKIMVGYFFKTCCRLPKSFHYLSF